MTTKKNAGAVSLGRLGGKARAKKLSKEALSEQGRKAVTERWEKAKAKAEAALVSKKKPGKKASKVR